MSDAVTVVLPCLNEEESLPGVLAAIPAGYRALVVDNNSTDDTAAVAQRLGAQVVAEQRPGYGAAVHAGVVAATTPIVAVIDADGSMDAADLPRLVEALDVALGATPAARSLLTVNEHRVLRDFHDTVVTMRRGSIERLSDLQSDLAQALEP